MSFVARRQPAEVSDGAEEKSSDEDTGEKIYLLEGAGVDSQEGGGLLRRLSNADRIDAAVGQYAARAQNMMEVATRDPRSIDRDTFKRVIEANQARFYRCLTLPLNILFFFCFALAAYLHEDINNVYMIESGLRAVLTKDIEEVNSIQQAWHWLDAVLVPTLFNQTDLQGRTYSRKDQWGRVLDYNQMQGPLMMEQLRSEIELCNDGEGPAGDMACFKMDTSSTEPFDEPSVLPNVSLPLPIDYPSHAGSQPDLQDRQDYYAKAFRVHDQDRRLRMARPEYKWRLPGGEPDGDAFSAFIYPNTPVRLIHEHISYLKQRGWLDAQTKQLRFKALLLNSEVGRPRLEQYKTDMRFSRGGGIFTTVLVESIFLRCWDGPRSVCMDLLVVIMLFGQTCLEIRALRRAMLRGEVKAHLATFSSILQWVIIICGWYICLTYVAGDILRQEVISKWQDIVRAQQQDLPAEMNNLGASLHHEADWLTWWQSLFRIHLGMYHIILMLRFFLSFHAQPRLAVVVRTLEESLIDIIHFLIVLLPTFCAYAMSGCLLFGQRIEAFSTPHSSIGFCFKILIEGEYDWPELTEALQEYWWAGALWVWTFMALLTFLMLNMVLAIILDIYTSLRLATGQSETVWETVVNLCIQCYNYKRWVSYDELLFRISRMEVAWLAAEDLQTFFANMPPPQAKILARQCNVEKELENRIESAGKQEWAKMLMTEKLVVDSVCAELSDLSNGIEESDGQSVPATAWLEPIAKEMAAQNHLMVGMQWRLSQLQWQWEATKAIHGADVTFDSVQQMPTEAPQTVL